MIMLLTAKYYYRTKNKIIVINYVVSYYQHFILVDIFRESALVCCSVGCKGNTSNKSTTRNISFYRLPKRAFSKLFPTTFDYMQDPTNSVRSVPRVRQFFCVYQKFLNRTYLYMSFSVSPHVVLGNA